MSSESESSYCSTCSESHFETSISDTSLEDEDIEYINHLRQSSDPQLFYLELIDEKTPNECQTQNSEESTSKISQSLLSTHQSLRSSYTKLTSWVFNNKNKSKNKSLKRKSTKQKTNLDPIVTNSGDKPTIEVLDCDQNNTNALNSNSNKLLFDLIKGKNESNLLKVDNELILMYLMPPNETQNECLIYSYPKQESEDSINPILLKLKGMFVTLSEIVYQITNQTINLSSVAVNDQNREQIYEIGFIHESNCLLMLALPHNKFTDIEVEAIVQTITRVIKFIYNSLSSAFDNQSNHSNLNTIFRVLEYLLFKDVKSSTIDTIFLNTIKRLLIDDELAINLNDSLSEYEAMDWLSDDSSLDIQQQNSSQFIVIGSCLLYKGFLLTSHLSNNQLKDLYSFLSLKGLLSLHKNNSIRLVFWSQVFPSFDRNTDPNDYNESEDVKYFVSIVGFRHIIHCTLLEMPFICSEEMIIKANEVVINESIRLLKSHFIKSGITEEIDHCFDVQQMAAKMIFDAKTEQKRYKSLSSLKDLLFLSSSTSQLKLSHHSSHSSLSSLDNSSISGSMISRSSPSLQHSIVSRNSSSATSLSQTNSKDTNLLTCTPNNCIYLKQNCKLPENLICYLDIEDGQQIFAGPLLQWPKDICEQIFKKFAECCYGMSRQLTQSIDSCHEMGKTFQIKILSNFLSPNKLRAKKYENEIHLFHVIGRLERNVEFYACFKTNGCDLLPIDFDIEDFIYSLRLQRRLP